MLQQQLPKEERAKFTENWLSTAQYLAGWGKLKVGLQYLHLPSLLLRNYQLRSRFRTHSLLQCHHRVTHPVEWWLIHAHNFHTWAVPHLSSLSVAPKNFLFLTWRREGRWWRMKNTRQRRAMVSNFLWSCFSHCEDVLEQMVSLRARSKDDGRPEALPLILMHFSLVLEDWTSIRRPPMCVSSLIQLFSWVGERFPWI